MFFKFFSKDCPASKAKYIKVNNTPSTLVASQEIVITLNEMLWQPIDTAPRTGEAVLLWWKYSREPFIGRWGEIKGQKGWCCDGDHHLPKQQKQCTHWMPLPEPPKE